MKKLDGKFFSNVKVRKDNPNSHSEDRPLILSEAVIAGTKKIVVTAVKK